MSTRHENTGLPASAGGVSLGHSLEVYRGECLVFASDGKWLHPLFELEDFLRRQGLSASELVVVDKIVGRAAALLCVYFGVGRVVAELLSIRGQQVLEYHRVPYQYGALVDRILCRTEELLAQEWDPARAYAVLAELRARSLDSQPAKPPGGE
ncbi:MAG: DUF1893 domain-containing protein [candidate division KSB1 bacterium]|nr:DUF1893 domain-containing protein [candidate division KSB1 bacterium]